jgi:hypothetical protein
MDRMARDGGGASVPALRPGTTQKASYTDSSAAISSFVETEVVRVVSTTDCYVTVAGTPVATTSHMFLPAHTVEYIRCDASVDKVAAIRVNTSGDLFVTEF